MLSAQSLLVWPVVCIALFVLYLRNGRVHRNQIGRATGEEEARFVIPLLVDPCFQHSHCWFGQWCASLFSSFTFATDVCTGTRSEERRGKRKHDSSSPCSLIHAFSTVIVGLASGVHRSFRPLPSQRTCAPEPSATSLCLNPVISESRSPVCTANNSRAWLR